MSRDPITRMDVDTRWLFTDHTRKLQTAHPEAWPTYWCAYQVVLAESWWKGQRVTLADAWSPVIPGTMDDALAALQAADLVDKAGRVTLNAWKKWFEPALERIERRKAAGKAGAEGRWNKHGERKPNAMRSHSVGDAPRQPSTPSTQATPPDASDGRQEDDAVEAFYRLTVSFPTGKTLAWLNDLTRDFGDAATAAALTAEVAISDDRRTLLSRTQDRLRAGEHQAAKEREARERAAAAAERERIESMPEEQRAANLKRLGDMLRQNGIIPAEAES